MARVTFVNHSEYLQLENFTPIPLGWLKFFGGLLNFLILMGVILFGMHLIIWNSWFSAPAKVAIAAFGGTLIIAITLYFTTGSRRKWIRSYFAHNVRGYVARFWVNEAVSKERWCCEIYFGWTEKFVAPLGALALEVRLGGWISTGGTGIMQGPVDARTICTLRNWSVRLHEIHFHTDAVLVNVEYSHPSSDGKHETLVLEVSEAIRFLAFVQQTGNGVASISDALCRYQHSLDDRTAELGQAREELRQSSGREAMFIEQLESLATRIFQTDRLKSTIEGLGIYIQVLEALRLAYHATDQAKYDKVSDKLDQAKRDLDRLRGKRSRRRREIPLVAR